MTIRVGIADDERLFCSGIGMLIGSQDDLSFAGAVHRGDDVVELVASAAPDVLLMDIRMPGLDGISATESLAVRGEPTPRVIVLTTHRGDIAVQRALRAGARGFLMKDTTPELLLAAIRTVHGGGTVVAPTEPASLVRDIPAQPARARDDAAIAPLSPREREVYLLAARGRSNAEIAALAFISETTVKSHVSAILAKLELASRLQIVAHAWEHGLLA